MLSISGNLLELSFGCYTSSELQDIVRARLRHAADPSDAESEPISVFEEGALALAASHAAKSSGDARKALHLAQ